MDTSLSGQSSPTAEDLLLCIEKEKLELIKLKKDLESYKAQNQRRRHRHIAERDWDDALCNLKQVSESKLMLAPSKEITGKLQFKSRDTLKDALQSNIKEKPSSVRSSGLALISTSTASLQRAPETNKPTETIIPPGHLPLDLLTSSQFQESPPSESELENFPSPPLQYISLPTQFSKSATPEPISTANGTSTENDTTKSSEPPSKPPPTRSHKDYDFRYRNSIAVDQFSSSKPHDSYDGQSYSSPVLEMIKASSLPNSPNPDHCDSDLEDMYEDLSEADDLMSLKDQLEGVEEEQEKSRGIPPRPTSRMDFRTSAVSGSNSTFSVPTPRNYSSEQHFKTSPLESTPLNGSILGICQSKANEDYSELRSMTLNSVSQSTFCSPVKAKSVRFMSPVAENMESFSSEGLNEGFDLERSLNLTNIFPSSKSSMRQAKSEFEDNKKALRASLALESTQVSSVNSSSSDLSQIFELQLSQATPNQDNASSDTNNSLSIARRVAESGSNRSSCSQILSPNDDILNLNQFNSNSFIADRNEISTDSGPKFEPTYDKTSDTQHLNLVTMFGSVSDSNVDTTQQPESSLSTNDLAQPKSSPSYTHNPFAYAKGNLDTVDHPTDSDPTYSKVGPSVFDSELAKAEAEVKVGSHSSDFVATLSPLNDYQPSPFVYEPQPISPTVIDQMVRNAFFAQKEPYSTPKASPQDLNLDQGDMTVTPRRIKERKTCLFQTEEPSASNITGSVNPEKSSYQSKTSPDSNASNKVTKSNNGGGNTLSFSQLISSGTSSASDTPKSKSLSRESKSSSTTPRHLKNSHSDINLRGSSDNSLRDIQEVSTLPESKGSHYGVKLMSSLDTDIEKSLSYSGVARKSSVKFSFKTTRSRSQRNATSTSNIRNRLFKFGSASNLSLVSKFDKGTGSSVSRKETQSPSESSPSRRAPILQRLRKMVYGDNHSVEKRRLYQFDDSKLRTLIASDDEISVKLLLSRNTYVLEVNDTLFLWFGQQSSDLKQQQASRFAGALLKNTQPESSAHQTIRVEFEGSEHSVFTEQFPDWGSATSIDSKLANLTSNQYLGNPNFSEVYNRPWQASVVDLDDCQQVSLKIWLMRNTSDHIELPATEHGIFFASEAYVMLYHYRDSRNVDHHVVFYWIGRNSKRAREPILPPSKVALDSQNEALMIQVLQGRESEIFLKLFNGLIVVRWGARKSLPTTQTHLKLDNEFNSHSGAHTNADRALYHVSGLSASSVKAEQTTCSSRYLCSGHSFLLIAKGKVFVWHGLGSFLFERLAAVMIAKRIAPPGANIQEIREKLEPRKFWAGFASERMDYADALQWARKPFLQGQYHVRLFQLAHSLPGGLTVQELHPFHQMDLVPQHAYILDTYFDLFLWCRYDGGPRLFSLSKDPTSPSATLFSYLHLCMEYSRHIERTESRPFKLKPIMVLPDHEPLEFIAAFPSWEASDTNRTSRFKPSTLKRKASSRALPVEYLLSKFVPISPSPPDLATTVHPHFNHTLA